MSLILWQDFVSSRKPEIRYPPGEPIAEIFSGDSSRVDTDSVLRAYRFGEDVPAQSPLILDRLTADGWQSSAT